MRVDDFLRDSARRFGTKTALIAGRQRLTYAELDAMSDRVAAALGAHGIAAGDRVIVFMDNIWEAAVSIFAVLRAGAVLSPISPTARAADLAYVANDCGAAGLITQSRLAAVSAEAMAAAPSLRLTVVAGCQGAPEIDGIMRFEDALASNDPLTARKPASTDADPAMLLYSSAAMGAAKGEVATHDKLAAAATSIATRLGSTAGDVILCILPIAFDDGLYQLFAAASVGATLVLDEPSSSLRAIFRLVAAEGVTALPLTPAMGGIAQEMLHLPSGAFPRLRRVTLATGLAPADVAKLGHLLLYPGDTTPPEEYETSPDVLIAAE